MVRARFEGSLQNSVLSNELNTLSCGQGIMLLMACTNTDQFRLTS